MSNDISSPRTTPNISTYIDSFWERLIRHQPTDTGTLIGVPRAYLVPSADAHRPLFQELYYWDSFFMALGLVGTSREWLILDIVENMAHLIERFGFIPNGTRYYFTSRSQPPFFTRMVDLALTVLKARSDPGTTEFLKRMTNLAVREHEGCWLGEKHPHERRKYRGLSRYHDINYSHFLASCESGWDHSPRCDGANPLAEAGRWLDFLPVCLNSILHVRETDLAAWHAELGNSSGAEFWKGSAEERANVMSELFWSPEEEFFLDFDWKAERRDPLPSLAGFYPLWAGWATKDQAAKIVGRWLPKFLQPGGMVTTLEPCASRQWAFPNGWAPLQWIVAAGLDRFGYAKEANEIRRRWCETCRREFALRGTLSEKYNVVEPEDHAEEGLYGMVEGFGWTNAVYVDFMRKLDGGG
ncbi:trehalase family glycosidase [Zavarzinella formosa]|uniref:trehalase family glycosidase n=1 Tax=Zavarzinella formosa TaxID=360055 RepID=UPI0002FA12A0|nr:trehalase family glycosidase [Zavarzinella formosa]